MSEAMCPRCGGLADEHRTGPGYPRPGAISRHDNTTLICTGCGIDEVVRDWSGDWLPREAWADMGSEQP